MKNYTIKGVITCQFILLVHILNAQFNLSGTVTTIDGMPVPYTVINVSGTSLAATADEQGRYSIVGIPAGRAILTTHAVGYRQRTDSIFINGNSEHGFILLPADMQLEEIVVKATRVDKWSGMAYNNIDKETLQKQNLGQDAPLLLSTLPSVVVNSDAGNGIGYTGLRIRGSDATRINVTINGVPVNDAESQGTFWVNMPDLVSSVDNVQVQRGVGASSNGAGAFGGTINFQTNQLSEKPYAQVITSAGSFDTYRGTVAAGTGLMNQKFTLDARASAITSQGYIDRASSDLRSYYLAAGHYGKKSVLKFVNFRGQERTYQAWNLVPEDSIRAGNRTYNEIGKYTDANGNLRYYKNETDNYDQNNFQLHYIRQVNSKIHFNLTGHYTKGKGYYEQYRESERFSDYQMAEPYLMTQDSIPVQSTDLIRRRWLNNDFAGGVGNLTYARNSKLVVTLGGGYNTYFGRHFGRVIWSQYASDTEMDHTYYSSTANKNDGNVYLKANFRPDKDLNVFVDLQSRTVQYIFPGFNELFNSERQEAAYSFFNPKAGFSYRVNQKYNLYGSIAIGNKEPNRDDFVQSTPQSRPRHENMTDIEFGLKFNSGKFNWSANFYNMLYRDQLVLNGQINDVGAYNRVNVKSSFRRGVELETAFHPSRFVSLNANLALSQNKISSFTQFVDSFYTYYDASGGEQSGYTQARMEYTNVDIAFSPAVVSSAIIAIRPARGLEAALIFKYVSRQFLDNTASLSRSIQPYSTMDLRLNYLVKTKLVPELGVNVAIYNLLNARYETNGYTFGYYTDDVLNTFNYLAPAAPVNFLAGLSFKF
jgi:iron complex outermembrane recepter protein